MKKFLFSIICTLLPLAAWSQLGPQPYAILSDSNTVLTFYYNDLYEAYRGAMYVGPFNDEEERDWHYQRASIISVVFDESFAQYTSLTSTAFWFTECSNLETIVGLSNLNTENVLHMFAMFGGCSRLETIPLENFNTEKVEEMAAMFAMCTNLRHLDLSSFNTSRVTNMQSMFSQCSSLTTIYVSSGWTTANVTEASDMFSGCTSLVGGNGTTFNSNHTDASFAHIDSENDPGYLTGATSGDEPYWQELQYTIEYGTEVMMRARNSSSVDPWMVEELEMFLERADEMYNERTASEQEVRHMIEELNWIIREVEEAMNREPDPQEPDDPHTHGDASFDGLTAWVNGSATLDDAFASLGRSEAAKTIAAIVWNADSALTTSMLDGINNPNLLVYVTEASKAPSGIQNLVINGTAEEIVLTDASGNNNFYCPQAFTAQSISYTRNFSQTTQIDVCRGWETICLPFTVQSVRHQSHGALTPFGGGDNGYPFWLRQLSGSGLTRATQIQANVPYLISMPNNTVYPSVYNQAGNVTFSASNVTVPVTSAQTASGAGVTLRAAFQQVAQGSGVYALNVGEARGEYPEGSVFEQNYRGIRPFQAYTNHNSGTRFITLMSLGLGGDDATGIDAMLMDNEESNNDTWYSLDGRRLDSKPTKKGVYIRSGKKIVIK